MSIYSYNSNLTFHRTCFWLNRQSWSAVFRYGEGSLIGFTSVAAMLWEHIGHTVSLASSRLQKSKRAIHWQDVFYGETLHPPKNTFALWRAVNQINSGARARYGWSQKQSKSGYEVITVRPHFTVIFRPTRPSMRARETSWCLLALLLDADKHSGAPNEL